VSIPVLLISGTVGSGKSTITAEINDLLAEREIPNAAVDLDALVWQWPSTSPWNSDLMFENLAAMWPNYRGHGAERLVLGRVLEAPHELDRYRAVIPGAEIIVCRLAVPQSLRERRLRQRMPPGPSLDWHLKRTVELETILEQCGFEDFVVDNGERPVRDVAIDVLVRSDWLPEPA
jgi:adenylylsulfate kinase